MNAAQILRTIGLACVAASASVMFVTIISGPGWGLLVGPPGTFGLVLMLSAYQRGGNPRR